MSLQIQTLTKRVSRLRMALVGPTGSGKTYTALLFARALTDGKILVVDTERSSAALYADLFNKDGRIDVVELPDFAPATYVEAIELAAREGYGAIVIDSLSHAWMGKDGALEQVDKIAKRSQSGNSFNAWREVTPMHNNLVDSMLVAPLHVIACMRAKTEYVVETGSNGKTAPRKVGLAPIQRDGMEYEFDIVADLDFENNFIVTKTRMAALTGRVVNKPKSAIAEEIRAWLESGAEAAKLTDPLEAFKNYNLSEEQSDELKGYCKAQDLKFSEFLLDAWNAGDRGFLALLKRASGKALSAGEDAGKSTSSESGPAASNGSPPVGSDQPVAGSHESTPTETTPTSPSTSSLETNVQGEDSAGSTPAPTSEPSEGAAPNALAIFRLSASETRKIEAAAKRMNVDLAEVAMTVKEKAYEPLMRAIDPEWLPAEKKETVSA